MGNVLKRNNVKITGNGNETILFAHGFGCDQNSWRHLTSAFYQDYKLILFDFIGAGQSDFSGYNKARYNSLQGYAEDIYEICNQLKISGAIFIGHSVSCMIGALAAIKYPSIFKKLIFIGPSPCYLNDNGYVGGFEKEDIETLLELMNDNYISWARSMAPAIMGNQQQPALGKELTDNFCSTDPEIAKAFARITFLSDNRTDLTKIAIESLTLQCSDDILAPLEVGYYIKENTPGNKLIILKATGHCPHMSAPQETINAIRSFI